MDVKSFYPSLDPEKAAKIARTMWEKAPIIVENVDYDELSKYLGMNLSEEVLRSEKLLDVVYRKRVMKLKRNKTKHTNEIKTIKQKKDNKNRKMKNKTKNELFGENWMKPKRKPTVLEKIQMFGVAFQRLLVVSTKNHIFI